MPISNDNQDFGRSDEKDKKENAPLPTGENTLTSDDLKGKKVDADPDNKTDKPADQKNNS